LLKNGVKNPKAAKVLTLLGKYGLNIGGEGLEESLQQGVSIANRNRQGAGTFDLAEKTAGTVWDAVTGKTPAAWREMLIAAREGGKVAALFGGAEMAGNTMVASGLTNGILGEHTVTKPTDRLIAEWDTQLRAGERPDDAHLDAMEVSEPEARGIMSIMAMEEMDEAADGNAEFDIKIVDEFLPDFYIGPNGKVLPGIYRNWIGTNMQKKFLEQAENPQLRNAIKQLYRATSFIDDGGTASVEKSTGLMLGRDGNSHTKKGVEMIKYLENKILTQNLSSSDRVLAEKLLKNLKDALGDDLS